MRMTFLGHVGFSMETRGGTLLCDPWFTPAYFGSWFPFPRNDRLATEAFTSPDYLYVSHLHRDHFDAAWLSARVDKRARVLLPDFDVPFLERELRAIGFESFVRCPNGQPVDLDGLEVTILAFTTPADGPLGDSLLVVDDGSARVLNQNDARPGDPDALRALGPFDMQIVQFSGAIWYPIAYDFPVELKTRLAREKRVNQMARARQYIEWVDAAHVLPCAGPPAFLDDDLFALNDFDRDPANIFPDQSVFLELLQEAGITRGELVVPGSLVDVDRAECKVIHPGDASETARPFVDKRAYLEEYRRDWDAWLGREREGWSHGRLDLVAELAPWFEPLLRSAPITSAGVAGNVVLDVGEPGGDICIDFVESEVRAWKGEGRDAYVYKADVDRRLIEALIERRTEDWVNSLFLSCRFVGHRPDPANFNEFVMTFFKALSPERIAYVERCYRERREQVDEFFERDGWRIERFCPHRQADLTRFGEIDDGVLTCSLHHWQFDLATGRCLTSDDRSIRCSRLEEQHP
ncbi:MAG TPA: Rieske 2Fe-2S domain-containing protein [Acidimicrobiia bacterium]|nr:Rieske 2Fe-2S domain-containing protein [Acidimicrobiia bacterium]